MDKKTALVLLMFVTTLYGTASPLEQAVLSTIAKRAVIAVFFFIIFLAIFSFYVYKSPPTFSQSLNVLDENDLCTNIEFCTRQNGNKSVVTASKILSEEVLREHSDKNQEFHHTRKEKEIVKLEEEVEGLQVKVKKLEFDCAEKGKAVEVAEANAVALKRQSEGFWVEYDRLFEENEELRKQLQSIDHRLSYSDIKKKL